MGVLPGEADAESSTPSQSVDITQEVPYRTGIKADKHREIPEFIFNADLATQTDIHICVVTEIIIGNTCSRTHIPVESADYIPVPVVNSNQGYPGEVLLEPEACIELKPVPFVQTFLV